ncbi:MAG TPA: hypothetical protein VK151_00050 [Fluviicola sp.]|nr:hypothetical protein [Fluviicola sp.]
MKALFSLLFVILGANFGFSQDWKITSVEEVKQALTNCASHYRAENYALSFEQTIFKDAKNPTDVIKTSGLLLRGKGKQYRSEQPGKLIIQNNDIKMIVDTAQQVVGIIQPDTLFDVIQMDQLLTHYGWTNMTCLSRVSGSATTYQLSGPGLAIYECMELTINSKTGLLTDMVLYFVPQNYFSESVDDETMEHPKIVIRYSETKKLTSEQQRLLDLSQWLTKDRDTYTLNTSKASFTLQDYRYHEQH